MSPTIRIDEEVFKALQKDAKPFVDTPNDVLRRLLGLNGSSAKRRSARRGRNVYVAPDGGRYTSRQLVERFGLEILGGEMFAKVMGDPHNWGLSHQADRIAKHKGYSKSEA